MLHEIMNAVDPSAPLAQTLWCWDEIASGLASTTRKRRLQILS
jgi:hypothetical protein